MRNAKLRRRSVSALKVWRAVARKGQGDVAAHLGVSAQAVSQWETGRFPIPLKHLAELLRWTGIPAEELVSDKQIVRLLKLLAAQAGVEDGVAGAKRDVA